MPSSRRVAEILRLRRFLCLLPCSPSPPSSPRPVPHVLSKRSFRLLVYMNVYRANLLIWNMVHLSLNGEHLEFRGECF